MTQTSSVTVTLNNRGDVQLFLCPPPQRGSRLLRGDQCLTSGHVHCLNVWLKFSPTSSPWTEALLIHNSRYSLHWPWWLSPRPRSRSCRCEGWSGPGSRWSGDPSAPWKPRSPRGRGLLWRKEYEAADKLHQLGVRGLNPATRIHSKKNSQPQLFNLLLNVPETKHRRWNMDRSSSSSNAALVMCR